jgi:hypothetical protein
MTRFQFDMLSTRFFTVHLSSPTTTQLTPLLRAFWAKRQIYLLGFFFTCKKKVTFCKRIYLIKFNIISSLTNVALNSTRQLAPRMLHMLFLPISDWQYSLLLRQKAQTYPGRETVIANVSNCVLFVQEEPIWTVQAVPPRCLSPDILCKHMKRIRHSNANDIMLNSGAEQTIKWTNLIIF